MSRKPQCPVTCHRGAIRPPRPGAPSCGTRHLQSARSIGRASCSRPRMDRPSCPVRYQGAGWHRLQVYRAVIDLAPVADFVAWDARNGKIVWSKPKSGCPRGFRQRADTSTMSPRHMADQLCRSPRRARNPCRRGSSARRKVRSRPQTPQAAGP
jgi:hypothetical protein